MRLNVYVPDALGAQVKERLPGVNVSAVMQDALRAMLDCDHGRLQCADCGEVVDPEVAARSALSAFWRDLLWAWGPLVDRHGTAEGAARIAKGVAIDAGIPGADRLPLPRPVRNAS